MSAPTVGGVGDRLLAALQERAKELNCLYQVEKYLSNPDRPLGEVLQEVVEVLPPGWQYPEVCEAEILFGADLFRSADFEPTPWVQTATISALGQDLGELRVVYLAERPKEAEGPFLVEEGNLIRTIADRLGHFVTFQQMKAIQQDLEHARESLEAERASEWWRAPVQLLRRSDRDLYMRVARKMENHLRWLGIAEVTSRCVIDTATGEVNEPGKAEPWDEAWLFSDGPFDAAARHLPASEVLTLIQRWILEDKASQVTKVLSDDRSSLAEIAEALNRYRRVVTDESELPQYVVKGMRVALCRALLTEQLAFLMVAKDYIGTDTIAEVLERMVMPADSHGKVGGKAAGLLLAQQILAASDDAELAEVAFPRSWYLASSGQRDFISSNDLGEIREQKYKEIGQVRHDYPNIVRLFKASRFPPEIVRGMALVLQEIGDRPLILRSSSLLEDRLGSPFAGKYKSLFLANRGSKEQRLEAVLGGIAEIYASIFSPDPIEYRREHGLLDFDEWMGILVQEVVGVEVGRWFLPAFAGVAFSMNEMRWSPRLRRDDGLLRLVPGLGTRAVDRLGDDYPVLIAPGQPDLEVNSTIEARLRYAPRSADVIDLEENRFRTLPLSRLLDDLGSRLPGFEEIFSVHDEGTLMRASKLLTDPAKVDLVPTFAGMRERTGLVSLVRRMTQTLESAFGQPVDLEIAHDGQRLYLLQCRGQARSDDHAPAPIPQDLDPRDVVFRATRFVSNGRVPDLTHVVYVDPDAYDSLPSPSAMAEVGRVVGRLNQILPKRRFALIGPGRWGSRGDIRLGVRVSYSDINNSALLMEIERRRGGSTPDPSFGTHFFQDLVEAKIRYLPLYPDEPGSELKAMFINGSRNLLAEVVADASHLDHVVKLIDVPAQFDGRVLRVLMNAELEQAVGMLVPPQTQAPALVPKDVTEQGGRPEYWRWRHAMAERIAAELDAKRHGVVAMYVFGSTESGAAGPGSDIDLLIHYRGTAEQVDDLMLWLDGWSRCLAEINYLRTGYRSSGLLDIHLVSDDDIENRSSFAVKIGAITDAAEPLQLKSTES